VQKEYYKLRAKKVIDLTRSHGSRCGRGIECLHPQKSSIIRQTTK